MILFPWIKMLSPGYKIMYIVEILKHLKKKSFLKNKILSFNHCLKHNSFLCQEGKDFTHILCTKKGIQIPLGY